jgi:hypothetical protein
MRLFCVALIGALLYACHWLLLCAWPRLALTRQRPLPAMLVFPRVEVMFWDATLTGVMQALAMLIAGGCACRGRAAAAAYGCSLHRLLRLARCLTRGNLPVSSLT